MTAKVLGGGDFTLEDFLEQMLAVRKMGPIGNLLGMLPGMGQMKEQIAEIDDKHLDRVTAIIRVDDPAGAGRPEDHQRLPPAAHRQRLRRHRHRGQPAGRPLLRGPQDDEADGQPDGPARCAAQRHPLVEEQAQGQEGAYRRGRRALPVRAPAWLPALAVSRPPCPRAVSRPASRCPTSTSTSSASRRSNRLRRCAPGQTGLFRYWSSNRTLDTAISPTVRLGPAAWGRAERPPRRLATSLGSGWLRLRPCSRPGSRWACC